MSRYKGEIGVRQDITADIVEAAEGIGPYNYLLEDQQAAVDPSIVPAHDIPSVNNTRISHCASPLADPTVFWGLPDQVVLAHLGGADFPDDPDCFDELEECGFGVREMLVHEGHAYVDGDGFSVPGMERSRLNNPGAFIVSGVAMGLKDRALRLVDGSLDPEADATLDVPSEQ